MDVDPNRAGARPSGDPERGATRPARDVQQSLSGAEGEPLNQPVLLLGGDPAVLAEVVVPDFMPDFPVDRIVESAIRRVVEVHLCGRGSLVLLVARWHGRVL